MQLSGFFDSLSLSLAEFLDELFRVCSFRPPRGGHQRCKADQHHHGPIRRGVGSFPASIVVTWGRNYARCGSRAHLVVVEIAPQLILRHDHAGYGPKKYDVLGSAARTACAYLVRKSPCLPRPWAISTNTCFNSSSLSQRLSGATAEDDALMLSTTLSRIKQFCGSTLWPVRDTIRTNSCYKHCADSGTECRLPPRVSCLHA